MHYIISVINNKNLKSCLKLDNPKLGRYYSYSYYSSFNIYIYNMNNIVIIEKLLKIILWKSDYYARRKSLS